MRDVIKFIAVVLLFILGLALYVLFEMYICDDAPKVWPYIFGWLMCGLFGTIFKQKCPCERCGKKEKKADE